MLTAQEIQEARENQEPITGDNLLDFCTKEVSNKYYKFNNDADREDAIQELCLIGLECLKNAKEGQNIRSYQVASIYGAIRNILRDNYKHAKREKTCLSFKNDGNEDDDEVIFDCLNEPEAFADTTFEDADLTAYIKSKIAELPELEKQVIEHVHFQNKPITAFGKEHGYTGQGGINVYKRACQKLQKSLSSLKAIA